MHLKTSRRRTRAAWLFRKRLWLRWLAHRDLGAWSFRRSLPIRHHFGGGRAVRYRQLNLGRLSITWWSDVQP